MGYLVCTSNQNNIHSHPEHCFVWHDQLISEAALLSSVLLRFMPASMYGLSVRLLTNSVHGADDVWLWLLMMLFPPRCLYFWLLHRAIGYHPSSQPPGRQPGPPPPSIIIVINDMTMDQRCGVNICVAGHSPIWLLRSERCHDHDLWTEGGNQGLIHTIRNIEIIDVRIILCLYVQYICIRVYVNVQLVCQNYSTTPLPLQLVSVRIRMAMPEPSINTVRQCLYPFHLWFMCSHSTRIETLHKL